MRSKTAIIDNIPYLVTGLLGICLLMGVVSGVMFEPDWDMVKHKHTIAEVAIANADINHNLPAIYNPQTGMARNSVYATSNNGKILFRLEPIPNDDPIWVLVTDPDEYRRQYELINLSYAKSGEYGLREPYITSISYDDLKNNSKTSEESIYMFIPDQKTLLPKPETRPLKLVIA